MIRSSRHLPRRIMFRLLSDISRWAQPVDALLLATHHPSERIEPPPVFIVGAPRTGSTILYQTITQYFDVDYISNFSALFYHSLVVGMGLETLIFRNRAHESFSSEEGLTPGLRGPHECGQFWYRWFPKDRHFVAKGELSRDDLLGMRKTISALARSSGKPLVVKNLNNGQRLQVLQTILPESLIIFCRRDPRYTAQSILLGRQRTYGDKQTWLSVMPKNYEELKGLPYPEQIAGQVYALEQQIEQDMRLFPSKQTMAIEYEAFCRDPQAQLTRIEQLFTANGIGISKRQHAVVPSCTPGNKVKLSSTEFALLEQEINRLYPMP